MGFYRRYNQQSKRRFGGLYLILAGIGIAIVFMLFVYPDINVHLWNEVGEAEQESGINDINEQRTHELQPIEAPEDINLETTYDVNTQMTDVVNGIAPTVVGVINIQRQERIENRSVNGRETGTGSGVIYKLKNGKALIVTNHHVVEGADTIEVVLANETHLEADLLGSDLFSDLAVLEMSMDEVTGPLNIENNQEDNESIGEAIKIGSSQNVNVGEPAIAIGNPLGMAFSGSVTSGVISGKQRTIPQDFNKDGRADWQAEVLQTDAAINPGNSGGALINIEGQLIGINSMKVNQQDVEGIGFAIPIDSALPIMKELEETGEVTRPYMGMEIYTLEDVPRAEWRQTLNLPNDVEGGVYIWSVEDRTPAAQAGFKKLDVIVALDEQPVMNMIDLRKILYQEKEIGDDVQVTYYRNGKKGETSFKLGSF